MRHVLILMLVASQALTACGASRGAGVGLDVPDLPPAARQACVDPVSVLGAGDWEIIAGRLGDALIRCDNRRALAVQGFDGVRSAIDKSQP